MHSLVMGPKLFLLFYTRIKIFRIANKLQQSSRFLMHAYKHLYICVCVEKNSFSNCLYKGFSSILSILTYIYTYMYFYVRIRGLVVRVPGYRSRGPGSIRGATRFSEKQRVLKNGVCSASWVQLKSYLEEEVAAPIYKTEITAVGILRAD
jgi:hypothetical protein